MANAAWEVTFVGRFDSRPYATGLTEDQARNVIDWLQDRDEGALYVASPMDLEEPDDLDDWEGPEALGYSESDPEAFDEMVRDDMRGAF